MKLLTLYCIGIICIIILFGSAYQFISVKIDNARYPPLGKLVDIGGYKLHIYETGHGSGPTIVLDMGMGGTLLYWSLVQKEISKFARVISYDRAGLGWSDPSPKERTSENIAEELHTLLHNTTVPGPYILVGHSFAGINARIFANKHPDEVAGVILVDSSHEDQLEKLPEQKDLLSIMLRYKAGHLALVGLTNTGFSRIYNHITYEHILPDNIRDMLLATNSTTQFIHSCIDEWSMFSYNLDYVKKTGQDLGDKPLIVITAGMKPHDKACASRGLDSISCDDAYIAWQSLQKDLLTKSTRSKQIIATHSGHNIPVDEPNVIVEAVKEMMQ